MRVTFRERIARWVYPEAFARIEALRSYHDADTKTIHKQRETMSDMQLAGRKQSEEAKRLARELEISKANGVRLRKEVKGLKRANQQLSAYINREGRSRKARRPRIE